MANFPLVNVNKIENIWFSGNILEENCPSIGQFLKYIDNDDTITSDEDKKSLAFHHLKDIAKDFLEPIINQNWISLKNSLLSKFKCKLSLKDKIDLRRYLIQHENENCKQFHFRCEKWQFLLCDDKKDKVFERDILINFVSGLKEDIYQKLVHDSNISDLETCVKLAIEIEQVVFQSVYNDGENVKVEVDVKNIKTEVTSNDEDVGYDNPYEYLQQNIKVEQEDIIVKDEDHYSSSNLDSGSDFEPTEEDFGIVKKEKPVKIVTDNPCSICFKTFTSEGLLRRHLLMQHNQIPEGTTEVKCPICNYVMYKSKNNTNPLKAHMKARHPEQTEKIESLGLYCDLCVYNEGQPRHNFNSGFGSGELSLALHKVRKHVLPDPENPKNRLCRICPDSFKNLKTIEDHVREIHFNMNSKRFECKHCGRSFVKEAKLKKHYVGLFCNSYCELCDMKFNHFKQKEFIDYTKCKHIFIRF